MNLPRIRLAAVVAVLAIAAGCGDDGGDDADEGDAASVSSETSAPAPTSSDGAAHTGTVEVVRVPGDVETIGEAVEQVAEGGLILVSAGTYTETVVIDVPGVTLRGTDRNEVIIDGEGTRADGVRVVADGVRVQNFTVVDHINNGVLVTGASDGTSPAGTYSPEETEDVPLRQRFEVSHVTASNNALYGIYAFHARHGAILDSYASGSPDSGIYVGQCEDCDILVAGNVAERNAVGFENANASGVTIAGNRFSGNRVGMTLTTDFQEAFVPQRDNVVVGNLVASNHVAETPAQAEGGFGIGIGLSGAQGNRISRNRIQEHSYAGLVLEATEDVASVDNVFYGNVLSGNATDVIDGSPDRAPATGNCRLDDEEPGRAGGPLPDDLGAAACSDTGILEASDAGDGPAPPQGIDYFDVEAGPEQPNWPASGEPGVTPPGVDTSAGSDIVPDPLPDGAGTRPDLYGLDVYEVVLPDSGLFDDRVAN